MKDFNKIINNWINTYTVPCTNTPEKSQISKFKDLVIENFNRYIKEGKIDKDTNKDDYIRNKLNEWFGARFINYNGEWRIILKNKNFKNDFYICSWNNHDSAEISIKDFVYELIDPEIKEGDSHFDDTYWVAIQDINDLINFLNIEYKFNDPIEQPWAVENGKYEFAGDGWDISGEKAFEESDLFITIKDCIINMFKYEYAPYTKYNPSFDFLSSNEYINNFDDIFTKLNKEQIINVLTKKCYDNIYDDKSLISEFTNEKEFIKLINSIDDMNIIKQIIKSFKIHEKSFIYLCNKLYNI